ncbi:unnamed protein product [Didymodactylos carnosus]|uniref:NAD(P)(+)--arginine ADP-ribosyltransferase n=1 Tax=Didymodactylos carnosus TaxID=1234261 RepID=A0A8S2RGI4_9BILA|nr:unnamed protein product [Didymodactylos carnosus]CAF4161644.1 unnamed protein product [Didymodactylos carnosus]
MTTPNCVSTIWLNQNNEFYSFTHRFLTKIDRSLITFCDSDECIDYITNLKEDENHILLIISIQTQSSSTLLQLTRELPKIISVYILNSDEEEDPRSYGPLAKLSGTHAELRSLNYTFQQLSSLRRHYKERFLHEDFVITTSSTTVDPSCLTESIATFSPCLDAPKHQEAEFMYSSFLREILVDLDSSKEEMVDFCRQQCAANKKDLDLIDEFESTYASDKAIFWYTRPIFLFRQLNTALREQDVDTLYKLRYFIKDLHLQLKERYTTAHSMTETVYRGTMMKNSEFDKKIRFNVGGFFSVSSFLSTTFDQDVAKAFSDEPGVVSDEQGILFIISIDKTINKFIYADISEVSYFKGGEKEILFTMGAVFRIASIEETGKSYWEVTLELTGEQDEELKMLSGRIKKETFNPNPLHNWANLLLEMGHYTSAERYYHVLLEDALAAKYHPSLSGIYYKLGSVYYNMDQKTKAVEYYDRSLDGAVKDLPNSLPVLAMTYNNLGMLYCKQQDYEKAASYYKQALQIIGGNDPLQTATIFSNLGALYLECGDFPQALEIHEKSLKILLDNLPHNHPNIGMLYNNLGYTYLRQGDLDIALEHFKKSLDIKINSLGSQHPLLAAIYQNLVGLCFKQFKMSEACEYIRKKYEIDSKYLPADHPVIKQDLKLIGIIESYPQMSQIKKTLLEIFYRLAEL